MKFFVWFLLALMTIEFGELPSAEARDQEFNEGRKKRGRPPPSLLSEAFLDEIGRQKDSKVVELKQEHLTSGRFNEFDTEKTRAVVDAIIQTCPTVERVKLVGIFNQHLPNVLPCFIPLLTRSTFRYFDVTENYCRRDDMSSLEEKIKRSLPQLVRNTFEFLDLTRGNSTPVTQALELLGLAMSGKHIGLDYSQYLLKKVIWIREDSLNNDKQFGDKNFRAIVAIPEAWLESHDEYYEKPRKTTQKMVAKIMAKLKKGSVSVGEPSV